MTTAFACKALVSAAVLVCTARTTSADRLIGSKGSRVFHSHPDCPSLQKIAEENRVTFASREEAETDGRRLCKHCERLTAEGGTGGRDNPKSNGAKSTRARPADPAADDSQWVRIVRVLPGGGLRSDTDETYVLWGVYLPGSGQDQSREATAAIEKAVSGKSVGLHLVLHQDAPLRDGHGRARSRLTIDNGKKDLAAELLRAGLAWVDRDEQSSDLEDYQRLETEAWQAGRGIWSRLPGEAGRREVTIGRFARHYHPVGCEHVLFLTDATNATLNEARARRLTPCDRYRAAPGETAAAPTRSDRVDAGRKQHEKE
jgi:hypothetical protein